MELTLLIILFIAIYCLFVILIRYTNTIPHLIFFLLSRKKINYNIPYNLGIKAELITISENKDIINAWLFPSSANSDVGILMISYWFDENDYISSLKIADFLKKLGYSVLLPICLPLNERKSYSKKKTLNPKTYQSIIQMSYEYFIKRSDIDKRRIGVYSNSIGTIFATELIKYNPIKAIIIDNGPVTLLDKLVSQIQLKINFPSILSKIVLHLLLGPFLWHTKWNNSKTITSLRACPTFLITSREDQIFTRKQVWQTYKRLYKPQQFWYEHTLVPGEIFDTWGKEYSFQIRNFYDHWLLGIPQAEYHHDFVLKRRKKGKIPIEIRITVMPPQLSQIPLQILLADKHGRTSELRIWFIGGSMTITIHTDFKPDTLSVLPFSNIEHSEEIGQQWYKKNIEEALNKSIIQLTNLPYNELSNVLDRYYFLKGILLNENKAKEEALELLKTNIKTNYWKNEIKYDSDSRKIYNIDSFDTIEIFRDKIFSTD